MIRVDVDCDELFMEIRTLTLSCALPGAEDAEGLSQQELDGGRPWKAASSGGDSMAQGEVTVRVVLGPRVFSKDFPCLTDGATYLLERRAPGAEDPQQSKDLASLRKLTGDKWRRVSVAVDPLRHIESQKAIFQMRKGKTRRISQIPRHSVLCSEMKKSGAPTETCRDTKPNHSAAIC